MAASGQRAPGAVGQAVAARRVGGPGRPTQIGVEVEGEPAGGSRLVFSDRRGAAAAIADWYAAAAASGRAPFERQSRLHTQRT